MGYFLRKLIGSLVGCALFVAGGWPLTGMAAEVTPAAATVPTAPAVEAFFKRAQFSRVELSPDGKHVALVVAEKNDRFVLAVTDVHTIAPKIVARVANYDIGRFYWVNNPRLVYSLADRQSAVGDAYYGSGLFATDIDGGNQRQLILTRHSNELSNARVLTPYHGFHSVIHEKDTSDIFLTEVTPSGSKRRSVVNLLRLNTLTGQYSTVAKPGDVVQWVVDLDGVPRVATTFEDGKLITFAKEVKTGEWRKLFESEVFDLGGIEPGFFGPDGSFYVTAVQGKDIRSLYRYDLEKNRIADQPIISLDGYDYNGTVVFSKNGNKILGIHYETDAPGTLWLDEGYQKIQKRVDELFPGKVNRISIASDSADVDTVLVFSFSDVDPGTSLLYNVKTGAVTVVGQVAPWIQPGQMAYQDFVSYKARDGLRIPAYLTLPKGQKKNLPMVVLVHGGPNVRGEHWGWNREAQFLASRGYAVLQPEYRGSTGYGVKHEQLGWKQWGLTMQDDVTDGTRWAIAQGIADPKRICIAGASYGGYATLWGLIKEHDLYQCGISWVGVSDLRYLYTISWSDSSDDTTKYFLPKKVGDLEKDAAQFKATSPVEHAKLLTRPLILAYGGSDRRVPIEHGTRLKAAMNGINPQLEWIEYPKEGHGWSQLKNKVDFWRRVERFLGKYTKKETGTNVEKTVEKAVGDEKVN